LCKVRMLQGYQMTLSTYDCRALCLTRHAHADSPELPCNGCPGIVPLVTKQPYTFKKRKPKGRNVCEDEEMIEFVECCLKEGMCLNDIAKEIGTYYTFVQRVCRHIPWYKANRKLTGKDVAEIEALLLEGNLTQEKIGKRYKVSRGNIARLKIKMKNNGRRINKPT